MRAAIALLLVCGLCAPALSRSNDPPAQRPKILILDGSFVHDVGELRLNVTNWGLLGSRPSTNSTFSHAPSAIWPAGSNVDHLFGAGLWVGGRVNGVLSVATGQLQNELLPDPDDPLDTIFRVLPGLPGSARYPDPGFDDDADGREDEDPWNALDDDADGHIDEDTGAIGDQYFRTVMRDDGPLTAQLFPNHVPLHVEVVQETFQWSGADIDDFVGLRFTVRNLGTAPIDDAYVGMFVDPDIGKRGNPSLHTDDQVGYFDESLPGSDGSKVPMKMAYAFDCDGDNGEAPSYLGLAFVRHPMDVAGVEAPATLGATAIRFYRGNLPPGQGGDPSTDAERYAALSSAGVDPNPIGCATAADVRMLLSVGPFGFLGPGKSVTVDMIMVAGGDLAELKTHAAAAALVAYGQWFDRDHDPDTGVKGRESRICESDFGPPGPGNPIFGIFQDCVTAEDLQGPDPPQPITMADLDEEGCVYIDSDCLFEAARAHERCHLGTTPAELAGCTGIEGREYEVDWYVSDSTVPVAIVSLRGIERSGLALLEVELASLAARDVTIQRSAGGTGLRRWRGESLPASLQSDGSLRLLLVDEDAGSWPREYRVQHRDGTHLAQTRIHLSSVGEIAVAVSPNPFNPRTQISYTVPRSGPVEIQILDARGRRVRTLAAESTPGRHVAAWDGRDDRGREGASGVYYVRVVQEGRSAQQRVVLLR